MILHNISNFQMRRSVSGGLYANTAVINKKLCNNVFENGVILVVNKLL